MAGRKKSRTSEDGRRTGGPGPAAAAGREPEAAEALLAESEALLRFAMARCNDVELARDAVQEACLRLLASEAVGRAVRSRRAWMQKVIRNFLCDDARTASRRVPLAEAAAVAEAGPAAPASDPVLPAGLTPREADCVRLRLRGHRYWEIAEILELHPGSVARLLSRAMTKLRAPDGEPGRQRGRSRFL
jgi:DNA-directed RNA polymerase specialized sigma24 family protein